MGWRLDGGGGWRGEEVGGGVEVGRRVGAGRGVGSWRGEEVGGREEVGGMVGGWRNGWRLEEWLGERLFHEYEEN